MAFHVSTRFTHGLDDLVQGHAVLAIATQRHALGIDAWRIAQLLLAGARDIRLDGVTGQLSLGPDGRIQRELPAGRYVDGRPRLAEPAKREFSR